MMKINKYLYFTIVFQLLSISFSGQSWTDLITTNNPNYFEVREAFEKEWNGKTPEKGQGYSLFKRWEEYMLRHMDQNGYCKKQGHPFERSVNKMSRTTNGSWEKLGPFNSPGSNGVNNNGIGRVSDIAFHPSDTLIFYVGAETGGVWKTIDGGQSYTYLSANWSTNEVASIYLNLNSPEEIWVFGSKYLTYSLNAGNTWNTLELNEGSFTNFFFPVFEMNTLLISNNIGALYSQDNGESWNAVTGVSGVINEFIQHPIDSSIIFASTFDSLYKSTDGGKNFTSLLANNCTFGSTVNRLAVSASEPNSIWLLSVKASSFEGFFKSTDGGNNFTTILSPTDIVKTSASSESTKTVNEMFGRQGWIHRTVGVSPIDPNNIFIGGFFIIYTENGQDWLSANAGWALESPHVDHLNIRFQPITNKPFSCNDGGIYRGLTEKNNSNDFIWESLNETLGITQMYDISISNDGKKMITSQQDNGVFSLDRESNVWDFLSLGDGIANAIDPSDNNGIYSAHQNGFINYSSNGGKTFNNILPRTSLSEISIFNTKFSVHPTKKGVLFHLRKNLWKSENNGQDWISLTDSLTVDLDFSYQTYSTMYNNPDVIGLTGSIKSYFTENAGEVWNEIIHPLRDGSSFPVVARGIFMHSSDPSVFWLTDGTWLYETVDKGQSWRKYSDWPEMNINEVLHIDGSLDGIIVATTTGVFIKESGSSILLELDENLPIVDIKDIDLNYCTNELYAATYGLGVWRIDFDTPQGKCCKLNPQRTDSTKNDFLCDEQPIQILFEDKGYEFNWLRNNEPLTEASNQLTITESGDYEVFSSIGSCRTASSFINIKEIKDIFRFPVSIEFENEIDESILIQSETSTIPFTLVDINSCDSIGDKSLALKFGGVVFNTTQDTLSFILPRINLFGSQNVFMSFYVASPIAGFSNAGTVIEILVSKDCGETYVPVRRFSKLETANTNLNSNYITPNSCEDWNKLNLDLSEFIEESILVKFNIFTPTGTAYTYWPGNIFLDNIVINSDGDLVNTVNSVSNSLSNITVFPNPVYTTLTVNSDAEINKLSVFDNMGNELKVRIRGNDIDTSEISGGNYILQVETKEGKKSILFNKK